MMTFDSLYRITEELANIVKEKYLNNGLQLKINFGYYILLN